MSFAYLFCDTDTTRCFEGRISSKDIYF